MKLNYNISGIMLLKGNLFKKNKLYIYKKLNIIKF